MIDLGKSHNSQKSLVRLSLSVAHFARSDDDLNRWRPDVILSTDDRRADPEREFGTRQRIQATKKLGIWRRFSKPIRGAKGVVSVGKRVV